MGSVTYAIPVKTETVNAGAPILVQDGEGTYRYNLVSVDRQTNTGVAIDPEAAASENINVLSLIHICSRSCSKGESILSVPQGQAVWSRSRRLRFPLQSRWLTEDAGCHSLKENGTPFLLWQNGWKQRREYVLRNQMCIRDRAYPEEPELEEHEITVTGSPTASKNNQWEYYVNQIHEMDNFVKELTDRLEDYPEDVVLVMYGDHLPTMGLTVEDVDNKYLFQTQYVMWDNFGLEKKDVNLAAYQMAAEVLDRVGIHEGTVFRYHQARCV